MSTRSLRLVIAARSEFAVGWQVRRDKHCDLADGEPFGRLLAQRGEQPETETAGIQAGEVRHPGNEVARIDSKGLVVVQHGLRWRQRLPGDLSFPQTGMITAAAPAFSPVQASVTSVPGQRDTAAERQLRPADTRSGSRSTTAVVRLRLPQPRGVVTWLVTGSRLTTA